MAETGSDFPVVGYVHKESSFGILMRDQRDILQRFSPFFNAKLPITDSYEKENNPAGNWVSLFLARYFTERNVTYVKRITDEERKKTIHEMFWEAQSHVVQPDEEGNIPRVELVLQEKDLVPVTLTDMLVLYFILQFPKEILTQQNSQTFCTPFVLSKFFPDCPENYQNLTMTWHRLVCMIRGLYFVTWKPKYEDLIFMPEDSDMFNALIPLSLYSKATLVCLNEKKITDTFLERESSSSDTPPPRLFVQGLSDFCANLCPLIGECKKQWEDCLGEFI